MWHPCQWFSAPRSKATNPLPPLDNFEPQAPLYLRSPLPRPTLMLSLWLAH